ncbi:hypothetical protein [Amycolatopsis sp. H20-H5]|uniref:hypothetical protein n=1 Tax=Amycolatopsis sp. H20-H5 TaxID=3046309 RepID=UPI002DBA4EF5|nr:hypothetical protein [Amycolatopsis sp. H20-H5]MEC3977245.1 hypothetical protein [Amycolatopsis sp. H20-H5]
MTTPALTPLTGAGPAASIRPAMVLRLLAGRGAFRLAIQVMGVVLIAAWGKGDYGRYASALGLTTWLNFVPTAAEKSALKIIPRTRLTRDAVAGLAVRIAGVPVLAVLAALVVALVVAPRSEAALYLAAAAWSISGGMLMTSSGLHRLRGRSGRDAAAFTAGALLVGLATVATWSVRWSPTAHLMLLLGGLLVILGCSMAAQPRAWLRGERLDGHRLFPAFARTTVLLGMTELLDVLAVSAVFGVLALTGQTVESGPFYLALMASSAFCSLLFYQLRLHQPGASHRLRGTGAAAGLVRAAGLMRLIERAGLAFTIVIALALAVPTTRDVLSEKDTLAAYVTLGALVLFETVLYAIALYAGYLVENTNSKVLTLTSSSAVVALVVTIAIAALAVPVLGPIGGFVALILGIAAKSFALRRLLPRRPLGS